MDNIYFNTTPIKKWTTIKLQEYLSKYLTIHESKLIMHTGESIEKMHLKKYREEYGNVLGNKLYLIIRNRIEKEEELTKNIWTACKLTTLPIIQSTSPIIQSTSPIIQSTSPIIQSNTSSIYSTNLSDFMLEPGIITNEFKISLLENNTQLNTYYSEINRLDANQYFELQESISKRRRIRAENMFDDEFINKHPPLLWQEQHVRRFLKRIGIVIMDNIQFSDIDDFIMSDSSEFENIFPKMGIYIYEKIRERFIRKDIKKLPKIPSNDKYLKS